MTEPKKRGRKPKVEPSVLIPDVAKAQALASRIFAGQCPDLLMPERLARVRAGLEAQGLSMDGVEL